MSIAIFLDNKVIDYFSTYQQKVRYRIMGIPFLFTDNAVCFQKDKSQL